jgi:hypothetical protein
MVLTLQQDDARALCLARVIREGNFCALKRQLADDPDLTTARILDERGGSRTLLHLVADWPGHFPNGAVTVAALVTAGAEPNLPVHGMCHHETPLHWAASSGDLAVLEALIEGGADLNTVGGSIANGTPLDDAVGYGQFVAAQCLVRRGAQTKLWHNAALGSFSAVEAFFTSGTPPERATVSHAFWQACYGGQLSTAKYLLARGADIDWIPSWSSKTPLDIAGTKNPERPPVESLLLWLQEQGAKSAYDLERG